MKKVVSLALMFTSLIWADMKPERVLTQNCLNNYKNTYLAHKDHKAFVYARENETGKDRCNWAYGYDNMEEAIDSAMKGCQSYVLNAECVVVDTEGIFEVKEGLFTTLIPVDDVAPSTEQIDTLMKEAKPLILGNCYPYFKKFLKAKEHKSFAYSVDIDGNYACGYSYQNQTDKISKRKAIESCQDNKLKRGKKTPTSACKVYMTNKKVLLQASDFGIDTRVEKEKPLTIKAYETYLSKAKKFMGEGACLIQFKYYLKGKSQQAFYFTQSKKGTQACGREEGAFSLDIAKKKAKKSCEIMAKEKQIKDTCKPFAENFQILSRRPDIFVEENVEDSKHVVYKGNIKKSKRMSIVKTLEIAATTLNKDLPQMIDKEMQFDSVSTHGSKMVFHYTLVNFTNWTMPMKKLRSLVFEDTKEQVCSDKETQTLLRQGVVVEYSYVGKNKKSIGDYTFDAKKCGLKTNSEKVKRLLKNIKNMTKK